MNKILKVKLLSAVAELPKRNYKTDAGMDLQSINQYTLMPGEMKTISTGIAIALDVGYVGLIFSRSGMGKLRVNLSNAVGVIDADYRGELKVMVQNEGTDPFKINIGDRIAQLVVLPVYTPTAIEFEGTDEEWLDTTRGAKGFGSSGFSSVAYASLGAN